MSHHHNHLKEALVDTALLLTIGPLKLGYDFFSFKEKKDSHSLGKLLINSFLYSMITLYNYQNYQIVYQKLENVDEVRRFLYTETYYDLKKEELKDIFKKSLVCPLYGMIKIKNFNFY